MRLCSEVTVSGEANYFIAACLIQLACSTQEGPPPHPVCHSGPPGDANKTLGVHNAKEVPEGFLEEVAYFHGLEQHTAEE